MPAFLTMDNKPIRLLYHPLRPLCNGRRLGRGNGPRWKMFCGGDAASRVLPLVLGKHLGNFLGKFVQGRRCARQTISARCR